MATQGRVLRSELVGALSLALDLTEGQPVGHALRCCWIGIHIGTQLGLTEAELSDLYYTLLLKDVGCSSNAARVCQLFLTDDREFKRGFKQVDSTLPDQLKFLLSHAGLKVSVAERFRLIVRNAVNAGDVARELIDTRCHQGADIARQMRFSEAVANGILDLDEHWNGKGQPTGLAGDSISLFARIALLSQVVDVFHAVTDRKATLVKVRRRSGSWFDPELVRTLLHVAQEEAFWTGLESPDIRNLVINLEPAAFVQELDEDYLDDIAEAFARVVDAKSPFTAGHSNRVAVFSDLIARELGLSTEHRRRLQRAALLHDIGKLGVSNQILDKPGKLDSQEWAAVKKHCELGEQILSEIAAFSDIAAIAGSHHEKLDGTGYPNGLEGDQISMDTRIVTTADIFDALTADRPYRSAMSVDQAISILREGLGTSIDPLCFGALCSALQMQDVSVA